MASTRGDVTLTDPSKTHCDIDAGLTLPFHPYGPEGPTDFSLHLSKMGCQLRLGLDGVEWPPPAAVAGLRYQE